MQNGQVLATVDLGSNSFRIEMARLDHGQLVRLDYYKEPVRLGAGLDAEGNLTDEAIARGVACLSRFAERLRGVAPDAVRAVATQSLRSAKNPDVFLLPAQAALGYPIEVISGAEEARLIYQGVANDLPKDNRTRLVVDIGGGSTELIVGHNLDARRMESMKIGCVSHTLKFFPNGKITAKAFDKAVLAAGAVFEEVASQFDSKSWELAFGSSGTIESLAGLCGQLSGGDDVITRAGMVEIAQIISTTDSKKWPFPELKAQRAQVLAGGLAVLMGLFDALKITEMRPCYSALRQGVMVDLLGRDSTGLNDTGGVREQSIARLCGRWSTDASQAARVERVAVHLLWQLESNASPRDVQWLAWAARTHELGMIVSHDGFHRHGEYIMRNADLAGFSRSNQAHLAQLIHAQRGGLRKLGEAFEPAVWAVSADALSLAQEVLCLRVALILCHARVAVDVPDCVLRFDGKTLFWRIASTWREAHPLSAYLLDEEWRLWEKLGVVLDLDVFFH